MLNRLINEMRFRLVITTTGPLLVRSGQATILGARMAPVMTYRNNDLEVYLPGSSLKGVFRSHLEKIICSLHPQVVCDPFWEYYSKSNKVVGTPERKRDFIPSCGDKFTQQKKDAKKQREKHNGSSPDVARSLLPASTVYSESCPTCRLFGSTSFIGRIAIADAYLPENEQVKIERRDYVGIDRLTGGAISQAKFDAEVVGSNVQFITDIHIRNFEIWQLGMLFQVVQDLQDELVHIGSGRARGLGWVRGAIDDAREGQPGGVTINSLAGSKEQPDELWGLGRWLAERGDKGYRTWPDDMLTLPTPIPHQQAGIWMSRVFTGSDLEALRKAAINDFLSRMEHWKERPTAEPATVPAEKSESRMS